MRRFAAWHRPMAPLAILVLAGFWMIIAPGSGPAAGFLDDRSEYLAVTGRSGRVGEGIIWMLDTRTEELIAVGWDQQLKMMRPLGRRDLAADVDTASRGR
jgi:hypothetical protein